MSRLVHPTPVERNGVPDLFGGLGTVNMSADRTNEAAIPWVSNPGAPLRKLTHFRAPGLGDPMWSGSCVYDLAGQSPSVSEYDAPDFYRNDDQLTYSITGGVIKGSDLLDVGEPTTTRRSRTSAHFDSKPAAQSFQGFANTRWSGLMAGFKPNIQPRPLTQNFNPNQMGHKELNRATQYKPFPPMGSIVGYFGSDQKVV